MATLALSAASSATASATVPATGVNRYPLFDEDLDARLTVQTKPFVLNTKNGKMAVLLVHKPDPTAYSMGESQVGCWACGHRVSKLHNLEGESGQVLFPPEAMAKFSPEHRYFELYSNISSMAQATCKGPIVGLMVVRGSSVGDYSRTQGADGAGTPYSHWYLPLTEEYQSDAGITAEYADLVERAVSRYVADDHLNTNGQFDRLIRRLIIQGTVSLDLMETCLNKVTYGKTFLPAVAWLHNILDHLAAKGLVYDHMSPTQRWVFLTKHLLKAGISKDYYGAGCPLFQTATGNIIELLESAKDEKAMMAMCEERLSPANYQRRTADASAGQIGIAINELGDFYNEVISIADLPHIVPEIVSHCGAASMYTGAGAPAGGVAASSMDGFRAQQAKLVVSDTRSFAVRSGADALTLRISRTTTIREFVALGRDAPLDVEIRCALMKPAYIASTTLDKSKMIDAAQKHVWAFMNSHSPITVGLRSMWTRVSHTVPMYEYTGTYKSTLFVTPGANLTGVAGVANCCFPEFLVGSIRRVCGPAFEGLNKTTKVVVPSVPHVVGLGTTAVDASGKLYTPVELRVNGIIITLTHL